MNSPESKRDQLDACGRRGGGGCSPATEQPSTLLPPAWGNGGLIVVSHPTSKAFFISGTGTAQ